MFPYKVISLSLSLPLFPSPSLSQGWTAGCFLHPTVPLLAFPGRLHCEDGWLESGKGQGAAKECGRFIFVRTAFFARPAGLSHLGMSHADKTVGVTETCGSTLQHPRCEPSSRGGGGRHVGTLRSWNSPLPTPLCLIPRKTSLNL